MLVCLLVFCDYKTDGMRQCTNVSYKNIDTNFIKIKANIQIYETFLFIAVSTDRV